MKHTIIICLCFALAILGIHANGIAQSTNSGSISHYSKANSKVHNVKPTKKQLRKFKRMSRCKIQR